MKYQCSQSGLIVLRNVQNISSSASGQQQATCTPQLFLEVIILENCIFKSILTDCISCNGFYASNPKTLKRRKKKDVLIYIAIILTLICSILKAPPSMCSSAFPLPALQCPKNQGRQRVGNPTQPNNPTAWITRLMQLRKPRSDLQLKYLLYMDWFPDS